MQFAAMKRLREANTGKRFHLDAKVKRVAEMCQISVGLLITLVFWGFHNHHPVEAFVLYRLNFMPHFKVPYPLPQRKGLKAPMPRDLKDEDGGDIILPDAIDLREKDIERVARVLTEAHEEQRRRNHTQHQPETSMEDWHSYRVFQERRRRKQRHKPITVQGSSLRTWSFPHPEVEHLQVQLQTQGRPLHANIELWQGPDNTPQRVSVYVEDGKQCPFFLIVETPRSPNAIAVYNAGNQQFPMAVCLEADQTHAAQLQKLESDMMCMPRRIQGSSISTFQVDASVDHVEVFITTDGRPLQARIEVHQGPNNKIQIMEVYTEDGIERPFYTIVKTSGKGCVFRILNTAPQEFPIWAFVEPIQIEDGDDEGIPDRNSYGETQSVTGSNQTHLDIY